MTARLRHYGPQEATRVEAMYPGHAIVEVITPAGMALVAIPITDKTRELSLPGSPGITPEMLLGGGGTIDTRKVAA